MPFHFMLCRKIKFLQFWNSRMNGKGKKRNPTTWYNPSQCPSGFDFVIRVSQKFVFSHLKSTQYKKLCDIHKLEFEILQITCENWNKEHQTLSFQFFTNRFNILISNFNKWTAKHLAQASCTELTWYIRKVHIFWEWDKIWKKIICLVFTLMSNVKLSGRFL